MYDEPSHPQDADGVSVHAGFPNAGVEGLGPPNETCEAFRLGQGPQLHSLDLNSLLMPRPVSTFMFRIRGEQGITQGIFDGDIALVDRALDARAHDLVLWHDGQHFNLSRSRHIAPDSTVWGVVTAVVHQYRER